MIQTSPNPILTQDQPNKLPYLNILN